MIVESGLNGDVRGLKESILGREVYDRGSDFDGRVDPIVRTEMRRLRRKLVEYYESSGCADPVVIEIPKGGYVPSFRTRDVWSPRLQGESLGPYTVIERLGAGPSGVTYRVVEPSTGVEFAAKQLAPEVSGEFGAIGALRADMQAASVLESEDACRIDRLEQTQDGVLLRSRFHEGITLEERLLSAELSWAESETIARQLLCVLAMAHKSGVAHGHLKPSDVLLTAQDGETRVIVLNFGTRPLAARVLVRPDGRQLGTAGYAECHAHADQSSDVRSAGAILCQLFTRSLPTAQAQSGAFAFRFVPDIPQEHHRGLATLITHCLAAHPDDRFANAIEVAKAFARIVVRAEQVEEAVSTHGFHSWKKVVKRFLSAAGLSLPSGWQGSG
jgi:serine/threonine protein kinase